MPINTTRYETELHVRPDDIDMNGHVHSSRYLDYVLTARYDQMGRYYGMPVEEFLERGFGWVIRAAHIEYKRPLGLGDRCIVRTWIEEIRRDTVDVRFEIVKGEQKKLCCEGHIDYTMIDRQTGRAEIIPTWIIERYSI